MPQSKTLDKIIAAAADAPMEIVTIDVETARELEISNDELENAFDQMQAPVFGDEETETFVLVRITK